MTDQTDPETIPLWARDKVAQAAGYNHICEIGSHYGVESTPYILALTLAQYIAKHDQPPADQAEEALKRVLAKIPGLAIPEHDWRRAVKQMRKEMGL